MALLCAAIFPLYPAITKYAMGVLKGSVHNCFFCYELRPASLEEEISFFESRLGSSRTLVQLLALRREYGNSFSFVVSCILTLVRLHWRTLIDNQIPRPARISPPMKDPTNLTNQVFNAMNPPGQPLSGSRNFPTIHPAFEPVRT
jgi:hypothetical protein